MPAVQVLLYNILWALHVLASISLAILRIVVPKVVLRNSSKKCYWLFPTLLLRKNIFLMIHDWVVYWSMVMNKRKKPRTFCIWEVSRLLYRYTKWWKNPSYPTASAWRIASLQSLKMSGNNEWFQLRRFSLTSSSAFRLFSIHAKIQ